MDLKTAIMGNGVFVQGSSMTITSFLAMSRRHEENQRGGRGAIMAVWLLPDDTGLPQC